MQRLLFSFSISLLLALCAAPVCAQHLIFVDIDARNEATPPVNDQVFPWTDPADNVTYLFNPSIVTDGLWLDAGTQMEYGLSGAGVVGFLEYGAASAGDTTTATPDGWWFADSTVITSLRWACELQTASACTADVFVNRLGEGPAIAATWVTGARTNADSIGLAILLPDSCRVTVAIRPNAVTVDMPQLSIRSHRFTRP